MPGFNHILRGSTELFRGVERIQRMKKTNMISVVLPLIRLVRGQRIILDADLAHLYGVSTSHLNQQFRRNRRRFPDDFAFHLKKNETAGMMSQIVTSSRKRNWRRSPIVYTEHGAVMAANVLKSERAIAMSVEVVRAFVQMRKIVSSHEKITRILAELEMAVAKRLDHHDQEIAALFGMIEALMTKGTEELPDGGLIGSA